MENENMLKLNEKINNNIRQKKSSCYCIIKRNKKFWKRYKWKKSITILLKWRKRRRNKRFKRDLIMIAQAYEDSRNLEAVPNTTKSVTFYGKVEGKGDSFVILGTLWGYSRWSRDELKGIKKEKTSFRFLEDSATTSTLTERMWSY